MGKELSIFNARRSTSLSDSVLCLGKIFENPQANGVWADWLGIVQKFTGIQKLGQNGRRANGIRREYFPKIQYVAAQ